MIKKPHVLIGALVGGLLTLPLMAIFFLGSQVAGLPFVPFDVFDFMSRNLPGGLITFGIDTMVSIITTFNLGETSSTAKLAEQLMALGLFLTIGIVAGAIFFFMMNRVENPQRLGRNPGLLLGVIVGFPLIIISFQVAIGVTATADPFLSVIWGAILFFAWGMAIHWVYDDLYVPASEDGKVDAEAQALDRRQFLVRVGGATATLTVIGAGLGAILGQEDTSTPSPQIAGDDVADVPMDGKLPNADATLKPAPGTRPEYTPLDDHYRIDISTRPPVIEEETWRLQVSGLVEEPVDLTLADLRDNFESVDQYVTLSCISNRIAGDLISTTKWTGLRMKDFIDFVKPSSDAVAMKITSADNFDEYLMLDLVEEDDRIMLAYAWDDEPLRQKHGFPLRVYIPDRYGMKQPKWISTIEFVDEWQEGYWVRRGWSTEAIVNTVSVIDTVATDSILQDGEDYLVPIGGIAYSGAKQISKVEVRVNAGEWEEAELRDPIGDLTWVIWRYDWTFEEGTFDFEVRAFDANGDMQSLTDRSTRPDGATGIHDKRATMPSADEIEAVAS